MKIKIFSRRQIEDLIQKGFPDKTAVISFYDPETSRFIAKITDRLIIKKKQTDFSKFPCMTLICLFSRSMV